MVERIGDFFSLKKPSFPTSREESISFLLERRRNEAKKLGLTFDEYDSIRRMRKERYIKQSYEEFIPKEIVNISGYEISNGIKNGKILLKNKCGKIATAYILEKGSKKPFFGGEFDQFTFAEKFRVRRTAFAHFDGTI